MSFLTRSPPAGGGRIAPQHVHHDRVRQNPCLRDAIGSDGGIISTVQYESSRGMAGRAEDVLDLSGFSQRVQKCRTGRGDGSAGSVVRSTMSRIAGLLSRPVCRPCAVAKRLAPLGSIRECLRGVDRGSKRPWAIARPCRHSPAQQSGVGGESTPAGTCGEHRREPIPCSSAN
jgi:hypothetical protein